MTSGASGLSGREESADIASVTCMSPRRLKREEYGFPTSSTTPAAALRLSTAGDVQETGANAPLSLSHRRWHHSLRDHTLAN